MFSKQLPENIEFTEKELDGMLEEACRKVADAKAYAVACEYPDPAEYLTDVYAD